MRTLRTDRLDLVTLDPERDAQDLHAMLADPTMYSFSTTHPTSDVVESKQRLVHQLAGNGGWTWAIRTRPDTAAIGTIGLFYDQGTSIRSLDWKVARQHWGRGIMTEAVRAAVPYLLEQPGITGLEAWIDSQNARSLAVARHAGFAEGARLPRVYDDRVAQQVIMVREAEPSDPDVLAIRPALPVTDIRRTVELLVSILRLHLAFEYGQPASFARLGVQPWSGSPGIDLEATDEPIRPMTITVDTAVSADLVYERAASARVRIAQPPTDQPWARRECTFVLPDGHHICVSGPTTPPQLQP